MLASAHAPGTAFVDQVRAPLRPTEAAACSRRRTSAATWTAIHANLPASPVNVIVEDPQQRRTCCSSETTPGVFVSLDGGGRWMRMKANMPDVAVTDLAIHPREADLVVATFGRGLFVTHIGAAA